MEFKFSIPQKIEKITLKQSSPAKVRAKIDEGFEAGYQAGKWQASMEQKKWVAAQKAELQQTMEALQKIYIETQNLISHDFPPMLQLILEKLFKKNPFTPEQIATEIQAFLQELNEAHSIRIECAPQTLQAIQNACEKMNLNFGQGSLQWKTNSDLHPGEYRIQSDLGSVDGRLQPRLAKLDLALPKT